MNEPQIQKLNEYKNQIDQLTKQLVLWEADSRKFQEQKLLMETLVSQWRKMELKLESIEAENKHLKSLIRYIIYFTVCFTSLFTSFIYLIIISPLFRYYLIIIFTP